MSLETLDSHAGTANLRALQVGTSLPGTDVLLLLVGRKAATDERKAIEIERLNGFRRTGVNYSMRIAAAFPGTSEAAAALLREHRPSTMHVRRIGDESTPWLDGDAGLLGALTAMAVRCVVLEDCYTPALGDAYADHVPYCIGINGPYSNQFLSTLYARYQVDVPWFELYRAAEWSFYHHHSETANASQDERPRFVTRDTGALKEGQAGLQSGSRGFGIAGQMFDSIEPEKLPVGCLLHFGTNRKPNDPTDPTKGYSTERDETTHFGTCEVVVPLHHKIGSLGISRLWQILRHRGKRDDKFEIDWSAIRTLSEDRYWASLKASLSGLAGSRDSVVYVHGYNVSFKDAALRAAQLAADLKILGAMNFFSWPSKGRVASYTMDEASIEGSERALTDYLVNLLLTVGDKRAHIIAHSMGNRGVLRAMQNLVWKAEQRAGATFGQIILAAPDVDEGLFRNLAGTYNSMSKRTTLYVSSKDRALGTSGIVHDRPRAGYTPPVTIVPGIDTIETSSVDLSYLGHGYYADARSVLEDIFRVLRTDAAPDERFGPQKATYNGNRYWTIGG